MVLGTHLLGVECVDVRAGSTATLFLLDGLSSRIKTARISGGIVKFDNETWQRNHHGTAS